MILLKKILQSLFPSFGLRNSQTVKYAFSFLVLSAVALGMAAVTSKNGSYIKIVSSQTSVEAGKQFFVDVYVYADTPVNAVDIALSFEPSQVEILGINRGESVITLWTKDPSVEGNVVLMQGGTYKKGFIGEHKIATINVKALAAGTAEFLTTEVKLLAGDGKGTSVIADRSRGVLTTAIYEAGTEPASSLSGGAALVIVTDIDGDGKVSLKDISVFMAGWAGQGGVYDFNNDGQMTFRDFSIILAHYFTQ